MASHIFACREPVCHHNTVKSPLISEYFCQQVIAVVRVSAVDLIVTCHESFCVSFLYGDPKASQIDFPERALIYIGIRMVTVIFLIITAEMLDRHKASSSGLYPSAHGSRHLSRQQRVFGIILKVAPAQRIPVDIHARRQPVGNTVSLHLFSHRFSDTLYKSCIPRLRQSKPYRK